MPPPCWVRFTIGQMSNRNGGWSRPFDDPIRLPGGRALVTLKDAADYVMTLPKAARTSTSGRQPSAA